MSFCVSYNSLTAHSIDAARNHTSNTNPVKNTFKIRTLRPIFHTTNSNIANIKTSHRDHHLSSLSTRHQAR